ncbi:hypothetical protein [Gluconacetobacter diazotrophicus]|uniref:hypothetical protein n=1 Tax=Gluconacetobacter diazotrophicus TaxID=33996 RepID=UPI0002D51FFD|nr:hypothetical protein [Gluconacetobacter diazotrophicus]
MTSALVWAQCLPGKSAHAETSIDVMEKQIRLLQVQLKEMKSQQAQHAREVQEARDAARQARIEAESNPYAMRREYVGGAQGLATPRYVGGAQGQATYVSGVQGLSASQSPAPQINNTPYGQITGMPVARSSSQAPLRKGQFAIGGVTITLGGFFEMAGIFRSRNEASDISSNFATIPWLNSPNAHMNEYHQTERQSRLSVLVQGDLNSHLHASGYSEVDFQGSGTASNSRQSNSYVLRARVVYGELQDTENDWYVAGGQMWSLATMFKHGMDERNENIPLVIDAQYLPGFTWTRNTGVRAVKGFNHGEYHIGLSLENPQSVWGGTNYAPPGSTVTVNTAGGQVNNATTTYSDDVAPDIILKGAADPKFGHFEALGMMRFLHDRVSYLGHGQSHVVVAGGGGGAMLIPIIKHKLDFQASGLVGNGIGRYGTSNLADATTNRFGAPVALPEAQVLAGLVGHPIKSMDVYAYGGMEDILGGRSFNVGNKAYGYGNPALIATGCQTEMASNCTATNIKRVTQGTVGFWWRYLHGDYGTMQFGMQYSYTNVRAFAGVGGTAHTDDNMVFLSMRYMPFQ